MGPGSIVVGVARQVHAVSEVGGKDNIVAVEMFNHAVFLQRHHPAGILVHAIVDNKNGLPAAKRRFHKHRRVQLKNHILY